MVYKKFFLFLFFLSFFALSHTADVPQALSWQDKFDFPINFNLNPVKIGSCLINNPWKVFLGLTAIVGFKLYYDTEMQKRACVAYNAIMYKQKNYSGDNALNKAKECNRTWLPFVKDPNVERIVNDYYRKGGLDNMEFIAKIFQCYTLADYLWIPGWFKKN